MEKLKLLVVIIDYKTPELTIQCLESLATEFSNNNSYRACVVNNSPESNSNTILEPYISNLSWCDLITAPTNLGFSGGNNYGIRNSKDAEYILLLNNDTIVKPGCISESLRAIEENNNIGALTCRVLNADGTLQHVARKFPTPLRSLISNMGLPWTLPRYFAWANHEEDLLCDLATSREVDWLGGAYLLVRANIFPSKNILDEDFFFYGEDIELCFRVKQLGYKCIYHPFGETIHFGGSSSDPTKLASTLKSLHMINSRYLIQEKCYGKIFAFALRAQDIFFTILRYIKHVFKNKQKAANNLSFLKMITRRIPESEQQKQARAYRPKRIAFILPGIHRVSRGAEVAFESISTEMAKDQNYLVTVFGSGEKREGQNYKYIKTWCIPREKFNKWPKFPPLRGHEEYEELTFALSLTSKYRPTDFDVVFTCSYPFINWLVSYFPNKKKPKHIFVTQNGDWALRNINKYEYAFFKCDALVCTNNQYFELHKNKWPCALISNGIYLEKFTTAKGNRDYFGIPKDLNTILICSALIPSKRVLEGVEAVSKIDNCFLIIAGNGPMYEEIKNACDNLLPNRHLLKSFSNDEMPMLYKSVDLFLHMSADEPFGNVYIEALASGLDIIAHEQTTTKWIFSDAANLIDTFDQTKLVKEIKLRLENKKIHKDSAVARAKEKFQWKDLLTEYKSFIQKVIQVIV